MKDPRGILRACSRHGLSPLAFKRMNELIMMEERARETYEDGATGEHELPCVVR